ncbi:MAG: alpha/beta hydrolase [Pseudanabaena sp. RU_4_16]|nr:alpha/beta hydrolase [Pseudanabaena sp. RU_4_16]
MAIVKIQGAEHIYRLTPVTDAPFTIVFLHGWLLSQVYWQPLIDHLRSQFQCLAYDLRGFGQSQLGDRRQYNPLSYVHDLEEILDLLDIRKVWLVGHSLGGAIALWAASMLSDRVLGVTCLNAGGGIYLKEEFEKFRKAGSLLLRLRPHWLPYLPTIAQQFARDSVKFPLARHWGQQRAIDFVIAKYEAAQGTLLDSTSEAEVHMLPQLVAKLAQPVYFFAGADDRIMEPQYVRHLASFHYSFNDAGDNVFEIPNCGHMGMLEQTEQLGKMLLQQLPYNQKEQFS